MFRVVNFCCFALIACFDELVLMLVVLVWLRCWFGIYLLLCGVLLFLLVCLIDFGLFRLFWVVVGAVWFCLGYCG